MKKVKLTTAIIVVLSSLLYGTSTGSTARGLDIDGSIGSTVSNGTNGTSWETDEKASNTTSSNVDVYLTWDNTNLYIAYGGTSNNTGEAIVLYVDTDPNSTPANGTGTITGFTYDGTTLTTPFTSNFVAYIKSDYDEFRTYSSGWSSQTSSEITRSNSGNDLEAKIPWSKMGGKPSSIYFIAYKVSSGGYKYGGAPGDIFTDGTGDATAGHYFSATISSGQNPFGGYDTSLPVELSSFSARSTSGGVALNWVTDSEIENHGFILSRKTVSENWTEIAHFSTHKALEGNGSTNSASSYDFTDAQVREGISYSYLLSDVDYKGQRVDHTQDAVQITYVIPDASVRPLTFDIKGLFPNPFNPSVTISYDLIEATDLSVNIYSLTGELVWSQSIANQPAAKDYTLTWNGTDNKAVNVPSGIYLINIRAGNQNLTQKVTLLR